MCYHPAPPATRTGTAPRAGVAGPGDAPSLPAPPPRRHRRRHAPPPAAFRPPAIRGTPPARRPPRPAPAGGSLLCAALLAVAAAGCGKSITREATRQLLTADSIDRAVAQIDFSPFAGKSVYLDTDLLEHKKLDAVGVGAQNYLIGSLRQSLMAAGAKLEPAAGSAEYVLEARAGAVGSDEHEVIYGMPANSLLSAASEAVPGAPPLPSIPEISLAKQAQEHAATKIRLFAYHRERREIVWQSGDAEADSRASHTWLLGAGPFEKGDIYDGARFAGERLRLTPKWLRRDEPNPVGPYADPAAALADYDAPRVYGFAAPEPPPPALPAATPADGPRLASAEAPAGKDDDEKPAEAEATPDAAGAAPGPG